MGNLISEMSLLEILAILKVLDKYGVTCESFKILNSNPVLAQQVARIIVFGKQMVAEKISMGFMVVLDYCKTLSEMIKAGNYDWVSNDITEERFLIEGTGQKRVELVLVHFNRPAITDDVLDFMNNHNLEVGKVEHLLAFGADYRRVQEQFSIVALGSFCRRNDGCRGNLFLGSSDNQRGLGLHWGNDDEFWNATDRFPAFRKQCS